jgi:molybdate transport system substrate-binding protein
VVRFQRVTPVYINLVSSNERLALSVIAVCLTSGCRHTETKNEIAVAAAANLTAVFQVIGPAFEAQTGIHPVFSYASTAQLTRQIENGAPFDIFAAADSEHVRDLETKGLLIAGSRAVYATGILALWSPDGKIGRLEDLTGATARTIAIAKPELAPYGQAAVESLQRAGIWERIKPKVVYSENISAAKQYGSSGNADAVFTAYSLVLHEGGKVLQIDERSHNPIRQELGILASTKHPEAARKFATYLLTGGGHATLLNSGYR